MKNIVGNSKLTGLFALIFLVSACAPSGKTFEPHIDDTAIVEDHPSDTAVHPPLNSAVEQLRAPAATGFDAKPVSSEQFNKPWKNSSTTIVIDAYQGNAIDWDKLVTDKRVGAVLHRSSIGLTADSKYKTRKKSAKDHGLLWGAYHLGRSGDPVAQAKFFLKTVENDPDTLLALDLEDTSSSSMMNIPNSVKFMEYVSSTTGRVPVVYANDSVTKALNKAIAGNSLFKKSRLWYARFLTSFNDFPKGIWSSYFLWQFSSEINCKQTGACLYNVPGTSSDMDVNVFFGTRADLLKQWNQ